MAGCAIGLARVVLRRPEGFWRPALAGVLAMAVLELFAVHKRQRYRFESVAARAAATAVEIVTAAGSGYAAAVLPVDDDAQPAAVELSVIMPAYNESARLDPGIRAVCEYLRGLEAEWELIVVDDGSADDTPKIASRAQEEEPRVRLVQLPHNRGKGHAVRAGALASRGEYLLMTDVDLSTPIEEFAALRAALRPGMAVAIGSRGRAESRIEVRQARVREMLGRLGNRFIRLVAVPDIADTQCGFKLFEGTRGRALFAAATVDGWGFDIELLHLCHRFGWPVVEVPVRWSHAAGSRLRAGAYGEVLIEVMRTRMRHRRTREPVVQTATPVVVP